MGAREFIAAATSQLGVPYSWGDESPADGFDCSGLVQWSSAKAGLRGVPRTARAQQAWASPVSDPQPGDLVFFGSPATHVGIYIGGGRMIHAPKTGDVVRTASVTAGPGGTPTYGRMPGLGVVAGAVGAATGAVQTAASAVGVSLGLGDAAAKAVGWATKGLFVGLGLTLVGLGVWRAVGAAKEA